MRGQSAYEGRTVSDSAALAAMPGPSRAPRPRPAPPGPGPELSVVAPTFNERANVERLIGKLDAALAGVAWEVIFVDDDSPDGTAALVKELAARDDRVRCIRRVGRRGLAGAVVEGALASAAPFVAVIDADMQHDETLLPRMLAVLRGGETDLVVGSRYLEAAGLDEGLSRVRKAGSRLATALGRKALKAEVSDPVSGFFMILREAVERVAERLEPAGFKILFDIIASQDQPLRIKELPYAFQAREAGESKMGGRVALEYLGLVAAKLSGDLISPRMVFFGLVGLSGVAVTWACSGPRMRRWPLRLCAGARRGDRDDLQLPGQQHHHLPRPAAEGLAAGDRLSALLRALLVGLAANVAVGAELQAHGLPWAAAG